MNTGRPSWGQNTPREVLIQLILPDLRYPFQQSFNLVFSRTQTSRKFNLPEESVGNPST